MKNKLFIMILSIIMIMIAPGIIDAASSSSVMLGGDNSSNSAVTSGLGDSNDNSLTSSGLGTNNSSNLSNGLGTNNSLNLSTGLGTNNSVPKISLAGIVDWFGGLMEKLVYLIMAASLVMFLYGVFVLSFLNGQKPESREQARKFMFWGIVSLFVMVSVWGLVNVLKSTFNLDNTQIPTPPAIPVKTAPFAQPGI